MEIVIACGGLPFGPDTLAHRALGGAETAVLLVARELRLRGHQVTVFCPLPPPDWPDAVTGGSASAEGVRYVDIAHYAAFVTRVEVDLLIASRDPALLERGHHARKSVLWLHDLATYRHLRPALRRAAWCFDEAWCLSEFHRRQVHDVTGYPLESLRVVRNGIARLPAAPPVEREPRTLLYAARPERGLEWLVRPDGVMTQLGDFRLLVCGYEMPGDLDSPYYARLRRLCDARPDVRRLGPLPAGELRRLMARVWAYVYPTEFEEVSCILARECIEQRLPVIATRVGALPETLADGALWAPDTGAGFVAAVRRLDADGALYASLQQRLSARTDLYWDDVAAHFEELALPEPARAFSLAYSLHQDGDLLAARAVLARAPDDGPGFAHLRRRLALAPPALDAPEPTSSPTAPPLSWSEGDAQTVLGRQPGAWLQDALDALPPGARVLVYGCGAEREALALAQALPDLNFALVEPRAAVRAACATWLRDGELANVTLLADVPPRGEPFQALLACALLECLAAPWQAVETLEGLLEPGSGVALWLRAGAWDVAAGDDPERLWNPDAFMLRHMLGSKPGFALRSDPRGLSHDGRLRSHLLVGYRADGAPVPAVDPLQKARRHRARQTCAAALIAMDAEETLLQALGSLRGQVQQVQVALGPSRDRSEALLRDWAARHPELDVRVRAVPRIEVDRFGFDDARQASLEGLEADWILWIDTDEYLTGANVGRYLRPNALDAYQLHQHHFSTEPRGAPTASDTPARLFRNDGRMRFYGKIHEQAEKGWNGLSGFALVLPDVDVAHVGYRDQATRRRRFERNRPFVDWDHALLPQRLIGKYVWLRDLVLRARAALEGGATDEARGLAREAVTYYRAEWRSVEPALGGGRVFLGLAHYTQALQILGEGVPLALVAQLEGEEPIHVDGRFLDYDEAQDLLQVALQPHFARRRSRYWD